MSETNVRRKQPRVGKKAVLVMGLTAVLLFLLVLSTMMSNSYPVRQPVSRDALALGAGDAAMPGGRSFSSSPSSSTAGATQLSHDASLTIEAKSPAEVIERVSRLVDERGGTTVALNIETDESEVAVGTYRVPAQGLTTIFNDVAKMGDATRKRLSATDVSASA